MSVPLLAPIVDLVYPEMNRPTMAIKPKDITVLMPAVGKLLTTRRQHESRELLDGGAIRVCRRVHIGDVEQMCNHNDQPRAVQTKLVAPLLAVSHANKSISDLHNVI